MMTSALAGFFVSISLIAAIGSQNAFVLRQALRREHVLPIVVTCVLSDAFLIAVGIAGLGAAAAGHPGAITVIRLGGAVFLLSYAALAARRALRPGTLTPAERAPSGLGATLAACLAFTYLNPHVYLDTVLLLGVVADEHPYRWLFGAGAALASATWFTALGIGAHRLAPLFARPGAWRALDGLVAVVMVAVAMSLLLAS
jgi:L-lysine exporter family protein LysE/ArgO